MNSLVYICYQYHLSSNIQNLLCGVLKMHRCLPKKCEDPSSKKIIFVSKLSLETESLTDTINILIFLIIFICAIIWSDVLRRRGALILIPASDSSVYFRRNNKLAFRGKIFTQNASGAPRLWLILQTRRQASAGGSVKPQCGQHMATNALISKLDA